MKSISLFCLALFAICVLAGGNSGAKMGKTPPSNGNGTGNGNGNESINVPNNYDNMYGPNFNSSNAGGDTYNYDYNYNNNLNNLNVNGSITIINYYVQHHHADSCECDKRSNNSHNRKAMSPMSRYK